MRQRLHIIAACADRKRIAPTPARCLRSHRAIPATSRLRSFVSALESKAGTPLPAVELYVGGYWATVRELPELASGVGLDATLWVASAGYGLVPASCPLYSYSATFQVGVPDSVASGASEHSARDQVLAWWEGLASWKGPARRSPRRIADLAADDPGAYALVIASPRYVQAMRRDLKAAGHLLGNRLSIVSSVNEGEEVGLSSMLVPSEASLLPVVGGSLPSLHARVARDIILGSRKFGLHTPHLQARYRKLIESSPYAGMPQRDASTDAEVVAFVKSALKASPRLTHTPALRMWRDSGRACEQKRFRRLFQEVASSHVH